VPKLGGPTWLLCALLLLSSCSDGSLVDGDSGNGYPAGAPAWLANGDVYFMMRMPGDSDAPLRIHRKAASDGDVAEVRLAPPSTCSVPYLESLRRLPDGALGAVMTCPNQDHLTSLVSIDPASGKLTPLTVLYGGTDAIWSAAEGRGWAVVQEGGCAGIAPIDKSAVVPLPALTPAGLLPWPIDESFHSTRCLAGGLIGFPVSEKSMDRVVVLASPEAQGFHAEQRKGRPWHVFEIDLAARRVRAVGGDFIDPLGTALTGDRLVVSATRDGEPGLHVVDVRSGTVKTLEKGEFGLPAISPDGGSVVVTRHPDGGFPDLVVLPIA
jgi:hypothetical protein